MRLHTWRSEDNLGGRSSECCCDKAPWQSTLGEEAFIGLQFPVTAHRADATATGAPEGCSWQAHPQLRAEKTPAPSLPVYSPGLHQGMVLPTIMLGLPTSIKAANTLPTDISQASML